MHDSGVCYSVDDVLGVIYLLFSPDIYFVIPFGTYLKMMKI